MYLVKQILRRHAQNLPQLESLQTVEFGPSPHKDARREYYQWRHAHLRAVRDYAVSEETLRRMAYHSLKERSEILKQRFDTQHITPGLLSLWYRQAGIRKKKILETKTDPNRSEKLRVDDQIKFFNS